MGKQVMAGVVVVLTLLYSWALLWIAWGFARAGGVVGWGLAIGVGILLALTLWVLWREVAFGFAAARLNRDYVSAPSDSRVHGTTVRTGAAADGMTATGPEDGGDPADGGDSADGIDPAREEFHAARAQVEQDETDWRAWYRLALAYDALRDRKNARMAVRRALELRSRGASS